MSTTTKEDIFKAFIEILKTKPFDKITVRDIVEECDINRNTFYYYYSDIYELLEEIFKMEFVEIVPKHSSGFRWLVGFSRMIESSYSNKKIINNICASKSFEYLENYMFKSCRNILSDYMHDMAEGRNIDEAQLEFTISFYQYAIIGTLSEWYRTGMPEPPEQILKQFITVFEGIAPALERAEKNGSANK
ncbi:MAG: TetR/AcrR family transcriptional regulator [Clostridia bacterium]|nr:TetR/AcrR family transcriptional regulator [Clostridia bacterium]